MANGKPRFGVDYDLERWSIGERDDEGNLIWHQRLPDNDEWRDIRIVTLNFDMESEGDFRNYPIHPGRPLDPYGVDTGPTHYDLDDLALQAFLAYGFEF